MARSVDEWKGRTDDTPIPARVKDRIARKVADTCQQCKRIVGPHLPARFDHVVPLILGGENRESNIQLLCQPCHSAKTLLDVKLKTKIARVHQRHLGIRSSKSRPMPGSRASRFKRKINGEVVLR